MGLFRIVMEPDPASPPEFVAPPAPAPVAKPVAVATVTPVAPKSFSGQTLIFGMLLAFVLAWHFHVPIAVTHTSHSITIDWSGGVVPPVPIPPGPGPGPGPTPDPTPAPTDKLRVIFLSDMRQPVSREQDVTLHSSLIRGYLNTRCMTDSEGLRAWRDWDKATPTTFMPDDWKAAMTAALADPTPLPKFAVFADTKLLKSYPVAGEAEALKTLQSWGGN